MSKIDNYIIVSVAEKAYEQFKNSKYSTFPNFCKKMGLSIESSTLTQKEKFLLYEIMDEVNLIYGLDDKKSWLYIKCFFGLEVEEFGEYYKYLRTMEIMYPLLFIDKLG